MAALTVIHNNSSSSARSTSNPKPIAPKMAGAKKSGASAAATSPNEVSSSTAGMLTAGRSTKRKIAFHPTLGYAIPPPQPAKVARRNARERNRVKQVNCGFEMLRTHIPSAAKQKKMSKVDTLRHAVEYIQTLQNMLSEQENQGISTTTAASTPEADAPAGGSGAGSNSVKEEPLSQCSPSSSPPMTSVPPPPLTLMQPPASATQYTPPEQLSGYPLTPRTPNTPTTEAMYSGSHGQHLAVGHPPPPPAGFSSSAASVADSGYETAASGYYSTSHSSSSGLMSPVQQGHLQYHPAQHPQQQQQQQHPGQHSQQLHQLSPQSSLSSSYPAQPGFDPHIPTSYYENSEEDELLDAIAKWQDQED